MATHRSLNMIKGGLREVVSRNCKLCGNNYLSEYKAERWSNNSVATSKELRTIICVFNIFVWMTSESRSEDQSHADNTEYRATDQIHDPI